VPSQTEPQVQLTVVLVPQRSVDGLTASHSHTLHAGWKARNISGSALELTRLISRATPVDLAALADFGFSDTEEDPPFVS
jgi:hypothetical protein